MQGITNVGIGRYGQVFWLGPRRQHSKAAFDEARCETIIDKSDRFRIRLPAKFEKESITIPSQDGFCKADAETDDEEDSADEM